MPTHRFQIGQTVFLESSERNLPGGAYIITKKLPEHDGELEYQVRSGYESHERIVRESHLRKEP
jgi:hypothetical protein